MVSLRRDRRGVSVQVGAIILFGFIVIALSLYQATVVPAQNEAVEFNHNQRVQSDMVELRAGVIGAATDGSVTAVPLELGTDYPARALFVNPSPAGGRIGTGGERTVVLSNASATNPETRDFLNGTYDDVSSRPLVYAPAYSVYQGAPRTAVEETVGVNRFPESSGNATPTTDQALVDGRTIRLVAVRGDLSRGQTRTYTVDVRPLSPATRTTTLRNTTAGNVTLTVPTSLTATQWRALLDDEPRVEAVSSAGPDAVNVTLAAVEPDDAPYRLEVGVVEVGTGAPDPAATYLTSPDAPSTNLQAGETLTVEVRDQFTNPVARGVNVTAGGDLLRNDTDATPTVYEPLDGDDGVYELEYVGGDGTVNATINGSGTGAETSVSIEVTEIGGGGGGGGGGGSGSAGQVGLVSGSGQALDRDGNPNIEETVGFTLRNTGSTDVTATAFAVNGTTAPATTVSRGGNTVETNTTGALSNDITIGGAAEPFDTNATLPAGSDTRFTVGRFKDGGDVDMTGDDVTVTVFYADGSSETYTVTAS